MVVRDSIIYGISLNPDDKSNDAMVPVAGLQNGYDVDFDDNEQTIYWVEHPVSYCPKTLCPVPEFRFMVTIQFSFIFSNQDFQDPWFYALATVIYIIL